MARQVYVISDLHLGGRYGRSDDPEDRGFRICTHVPELAEFIRAVAAKPAGTELIINGDLVDFLAEEEWAPFTIDADTALRKFDALVERDGDFFAALRELLAAGHRLTMLLGNHDIELSLPVVRARLREILEADGKDFHFHLDGEAYIVGDALIEHGNRYDGFNVVNYNALRQVRSLQSRRQPVTGKLEFQAPPGSFMVADVMNRIKESYKFVDLLKPETDAVVPILFALEPGYRSILGRVAKIAYRASRFKLAEPALPAMGGDISSTATPAVDDLDALGGDISAGAGEPEPLDRILKETLGDDLALIEETATDELDALGGDISAGETINTGIGLFRLLLSRNDKAVEKRLPPLLSALRGLQSDETFNPKIETDGVYLEAARDLAKNGFRYVLFGHTHLHKDIEMDGGARYLNSGTWADLIRFPKEVVSGPRDAALEKLGGFVRELQDGRIADLIDFNPTFIRLDVDGDRVASAEVRTYEGPASLG